MNPALRKVGSLLLAVVIVSSMVGAPVGTAQADVQDCTVGDVAIGGIFTFLNPEDTCGIYNDAPEKQDQNNAYAHGVSIKDNIDRQATTANNLNDERKAAAWSEAKIATVNALNNGSTKNETAKAARMAVRDYYTPHVRNLANYYTSAVIQLEYLWKQDSSWVHAVPTGNSGEHTIVGFTDVTVTIDPERNETLTVRTPVMKQPSTGDYGVAYPSFLKDVAHVWGGSTSPNLLNNSTSGKLSDFYAPEINNDTSNLTDSGGIRPNSNAENFGVMDSEGNYLSVIDAGTDGGPFSAYGMLSDWVDEAGVMYYAEQTENEADTYARNVYDSYQAGEIEDPDNLLNPTDIAARASTNYNQTGQNSFVAIALANQGLNASINSSVTATYNNTTYEGYLYYTADDVAAWEVNQTYNPANLAGTVYFSTQGENGSAIHTFDSHNITIESAQNPETGDEYQNVSMQSYHDTETNTSKLEEELDRIYELQQSLEEAEAALTIPSNTLPPAPEAPESPFQDILPALAIGGAALFLLSRSAS